MIMNECRKPKVEIPRRKCPKNAKKAKKAVLLEQVSEEDDVGLEEGSSPAPWREGPDAPRAHEHVERFRTRYVEPAAAASHRAKFGMKKRDVAREAAQVHSHLERFRRHMRQRRGIGA